MEKKKTGPKPRVFIPPCDFPGCGRDSRADSLCPSHWKQKHVYKIELRPIRKWNKLAGNCVVPGCDKSRGKLEYCMLHYGHSRAASGISILPKRPRKTDFVTCLISGCETPSKSSRKICRRHSAVAHAYKLTSVQLQILLDTGCWICGNKENPHIDHDHNCCDRSITGSKLTCGNCVRGILCRDCNLGIGFFKDNPSRLKKAVDYLLL